MYKCPNCGPECPTYDEKHKTCMLNRISNDLEDAYKAYWSNPTACFDEMD